MFSVMASVLTSWNIGFVAAAKLLDWLGFLLGEIDMDYILYLFADHFPIVDSYIWHKLQKNNTLILVFST